MLFRSCMPDVQGGNTSMVTANVTVLFCVFKAAVLDLRFTSSPGSNYVLILCVACFSVSVNVNTISHK